MQGQNTDRKQKYLIGNWKANKTIKEAHTWIEKVNSSQVKISNNLRVVICPSYIHIPLFKKELPNLTLGCQNLSPYGDGAYTGEVTARMLNGTVQYAILGHSERHRYFSESVEKVALKAIQALDNKITPIIAVDSENWRRQINALGDSIARESIIMYEPPEAISQQIGPIGKGEAAPLEEVKKIIAQIKDRIKTKAVIYGGSVKSQNIDKFLEEPIIEGVLPGSASLYAEEWIKMIRAANQVVKTQ